MTTAFVIDKIEPSGDDVHVHVRWNGHAEVFVFPKGYPSTTILAQIKIELRRREVEGSGDRHKDLLGKHEA